mmetsp:Transcript_55550/g.92358  ORF Transcript_55550/g.92358 Transcript_55550/m.92358 type:complete len:740 (+) Transcript_55550:1035-3254(+)
MLAVHQNHKNLKHKARAQQAHQPAVAAVALFEHESTTKDAKQPPPPPPQPQQQRPLTMAQRQQIAQQCLHRLQQNDSDATLHILYADNIDNMELKCEHYLKAIHLRIRSSPQCAPHECYAKYVQCLMCTSQHDTAYEFIVSHLSVFTTTHSALARLSYAQWVELAHYKFENDEYEEALKMYVEAMRDRDDENDSDNNNHHHHDIYINVAYCYQQLNEPKHALSFYYKYLQSHPHDVYCINNIAILEYYSKHYFAALQMYLKLDAQHISDKELFFNIGVCYNQQKEFETALRYFYKNLESTAKNRDNCLISIAWIYCKQFSKYRDALTIYSKLSSAVVTHKDLEFDIAWCYQQIGDYHKALKFYRAYLQKHENNVNALHNVAWIYINNDNDDDNQRYARATPLLLKILYIDKQHFYANYTYGIYLRDIERKFELALQCLLIAHRVQPSNIQVLVDIAKVHQFAAQMDKAKSFYLKAIKLNDQDCYANIEYAHFCALIENYKLSDFYYRKVLNILQRRKHNNNGGNDAADDEIVNNINFIENYTNYAHVLHKLGKHREAIAVANRAYALDPNDCNTLNNLGFYHFCVGEYVESEQFLRLCLQIDANHEFTNSTYANLLFHTKRFEQACSYYERAVQLRSDIEHPTIAPQMLYNYSFVLCTHKKESQTAFTHMQHLLDHKTNFATFFQHNDNEERAYSLMADICLQLNKVAMAQQYIEHTLALNANNEQCQRLRRRISECQS